ncbi:carbohydrate ABC transporter permease, partial [Frankia sp. EI5c]|uniref:carbohydrate ABC transporter permease n=1 Tax=Frankia sp. EI5c TaxID=683316 RepID=UPI0037C0C921
MTLATPAPPADTAPASRDTPRREPNRRTALRRFGRATVPYWLVAPFFVIFTAFGLFPMLYTAWISLTDRDMLHPGAEKFVGLRNYTDLLADDYFWNAVGNTFLLMALSTLPQLVFAL